MGATFKKFRSSVKTQARLVRATLRSALALYLYKNVEDADEIKAALLPILSALEKDEYDTEDLIHEALEKALTSVLDKKPPYLRVAFMDLIDTILTMLTEKIGGFDEDKILSPDEKEAYKIILQGLIDVCDLVLAEEANK